MNKKRRSLDAVMGQGPMLIEFYRNNPCIAAYELLGVDLAPIQRIIFEDMWFKDFVITVISRGGGKTFLQGVLAALSCMLFPGYRVGLVGPSFRQCFINDIKYLHTFFTSDGMKTTADSFYNSIECGTTKTQSLVSSNTILNKWKNEERDCVSISTTKGLEFAGTLDHRSLVLTEDCTLEYKELQDITHDDYLVVKKGFNLYGDNNKLPEYHFEHTHQTKECSIPTELTPELSYLFGLIVGDGCVSISANKRKQRVMFTSGDLEQVLEFERLMFKYFNITPTDRNSKNRSPQLGYYSKKLVGFLLKCGFTKTTALDKKFPAVVASSSKECICSFIAGLLDTDGDCYVQKTSKLKSCSVGLSTSSRQLAKEYQAQLLNIGILSNLAISKKAGKRKLLGRDKESICAEAYKVRITGLEDLELFSKEMRFKLERKQLKLLDYLDSCSGTTTTTHKIPYSELLCLRLIDEIRPYLTRGSADVAFLGKLKNNAQNSKTGISTKRVLDLLDIAEKYNVGTEDSKQLKKLVGLNLSFVQPIKIKHLKAETIDIEVDNESCYWASGFIHHNSKMIFSEVEKLYNNSSIFRESTEKRPIRGSDTAYVKFKSVEGSNHSFLEAIPLGNDGAKIRGSRFYLLCVDELAQVPEKILDMVLRPMGATKQDPMANVRRIEDMKNLLKLGLATEDDFEEQKTNKMIMTSSGYYKFNHMYRRMRSYWERMEIDGDNCRYAVHQVPHEFLPEGFLDPDNIKEALRVMSNHEYRMEYEAEMISDSEGFFKASLLEMCTLGSGFNIELKGDKEGKYIIGMDPNQGGSARCGVIVIRIGETNKIVNIMELKGTKTQDLCVAIQTLCEQYNVIRIFMDKGGGGKAVCDLLEEGYDKKEPIIDHTNDDHKFFKGRHILEMVTFNTSWISDANFATLSLFEDKRLLFPEVPTASSKNKAIAALIDKQAMVHETMQKLKKQCLNIIVSQTGTGHLHFDTPKKGQNKDLYSALILSGWGIREIEKELEGDQEPILYSSSGMVRAHKPGATWDPLTSAGPAISTKSISMAVLSKKIK